MKLLGLIGGVSPESTVFYYRLLNAAARAAIGAEHSARALFYTLDYGDMITHYRANDWDAFNREVSRGAIALKNAGVDAIVITSNTTHVGAQAASEASGLPLIHLLDVLADELRRQGARKPLLLGTSFVMNGPFYIPALKSRYAGDILVPDRAEQSIVERIILDELVHGEVIDESRDDLLRIIASHDCDCIILGCTELCLILEQSHLSKRILDTTSMHANAAASFMLEEDGAH